MGIEKRPDDIEPAWSEVILTRTNSRWKLVAMLLCIPALIHMIAFVLWEVRLFGLRWQYLNILLVLLYLIFQYSIEYLMKRRGDMTRGFTIHLARILQIVDIYNVRVEFNLRRDKLHLLVPVADAVVNSAFDSARCMFFRIKPIHRFREQGVNFVSD